MLEPKASRPKHSPKGRVITFYSYKGGTGRSMAVANIAWMLAFCGERVLVIDWDLEAPGIHHYFHPFLNDKELSETEGLLDFVDKLAGRAAVASEPLSVEDVDIVEYIKVLNWPANSSLRWDMFGPFAGIDLLMAGRQCSAYGQKLNAFNWIDFYEKLDGRRLLEIAREQMRGIYDYILIDSRTGVSDTSGICTVEMPDSVVVCFTLNNQSINGASGVADSVLEQWKARFAAPSQVQSAAAVAASSQSAQPASVSFASSEFRSQGEASGSLPSRPFPLRIFPVPTRVEIVSERVKREAALDFAQRKFSSFLEHLPRDLRNRYWMRVQLPYFPFYAFEEIPAVFGDAASDELSLSTPLKHIARYITDNQSLELQPLDKEFEEAEKIRKEILSWYVRKGDVTPPDAVQLCQANYDQLDRDGQMVMRKVMLRLVQVIPGSPPSLATVLRDDFEGVSKQHILDRLAKAGLLQSSGSSIFLTDRRIVENWDLLRQWLKEDFDFLLWRQKLVVAVRSWQDHSFDQSALLRGALLTEALKWVWERPNDLNSSERSYILASRKFKERRRLGWIATMAAATLVTLGLVYILYVRPHQSAVTPAQVIARAQDDVNQDPLTSALLLMEIRDYKASAADRSFAFKVAGSDYPEAVLRTAYYFGGLEFSPDGKMLVTTGGPVAELWDAVTWKKIGDIGGGLTVILSASFNGWHPDAAKQHAASGQIDRIVTTDELGTLQLWDLAGKKLGSHFAANLQPKYFEDCLTPGAGKKLSLQEINGLGIPLYARFSPDETAIIVAYKSGVLVMMQPMKSWPCVDVYNPHGGPTAFSQDGEWAATLSMAPTPTPKPLGQLPASSSLVPLPTILTLLHLQDGKPELHKIDLPDSLPALRVASVVGNKFVLIQGANQSSLWESSSPSHAEDSGVGGAYILSSLSADGRYFAGVASAPSLSTHLVIYPVSNTTDPRVLPLPPLNSPNSLYFDPSSTRLLIASNDQNVRVWPVQKNPPPSASASWQEIIDYLRRSTKACLAAEDRIKLLSESQADANTKSQQCEAAQK